MTTGRQITKAIKDRFGLENVKISKAQGMCRFYSDDDWTVDFSLLDAVYVPYISMMTADRWADELEYGLKATGQLRNGLCCIGY